MVARGDDGARGGRLMHGPWAGVGTLVATQVAHGQIVTLPYRASPHPTTAVRCPAVLPARCQGMRFGQRAVTLLRHALRSSGG